MSETLFHVVIVGYRPVDQILASLLGQAGCLVAVFEQHLSLSPLPHAVHCDDEMARILQVAGAMQDARQIIEPTRHSQWRTTKDEILLSLGWSGVGPSGWLVSNLCSQPDLRDFLEAGDGTASSLKEVLDLAANFQLQLVGFPHRSRTANI